MSMQNHTHILFFKETYQKDIHGKNAASLTNDVGKILCLHKEE